MRIGVIKETTAGETRVAATPETVKKLAAIPGFSVAVEAGAGAASSLLDEAYVAAGATVSASAADVLSGSDVVLKVRAPGAEELAAMKSGTHLIGMLNPFNADGIAAIKGKGVNGFSLERAPRTTRAQSLDVLSSQANIAGYKAVILAANHYPKFFPMLMTAAGTVRSGFRVSTASTVALSKPTNAVIATATPEARRPRSGVCASNASCSRRSSR